MRHAFQDFSRPFSQSIRSHIWMSLLAVSSPRTRLLSCYVPASGIISTARDTDSAGHLYLGCFEDDFKKRALSGKKYVDAHMTTKVSYSRRNTVESVRVLSGVCELFIKTKGSQSSYFGEGLRAFSFRDWTCRAKGF